MVIIPITIHIIVIIAITIGNIIHTIVIVAMICKVVTTMMTTMAITINTVIAIVIIVVIVVIVVIIISPRERAEACYLVPMPAAPRRCAWPRPAASQQGEAVANGWATCRGARSATAVNGPSLGPTVRDRANYGGGVG